jgi:hypothetical protein
VNFSNLVVSLGYESVYIHAYPYVPLDTTGVKMLVLATFYSIHDEYYTPDEIQAIKDLVNGGGICIVCVDHEGVYGSTDTIDQLFSELKMDCSYGGGIYNTFPYTDFADDPINAGVTEISGKDCANLNVFGDGIILMRGKDIAQGDLVYTAISKFPWKG